MIICRGANDTDTQIFTSLFRDKLSLQGARIYVPSMKSDKLLYCEVKAKCPRMRELIHSKWLVMTGITELVEESQSRHPCYHMYKHDHPNIDGVNAWV